MQKKKTPVALFIAVFAALAVLVVVQNLVREKTILLTVADNAGVSVLETIGDSLVCVFQDGQAAVWDWNTLSAQQADFKVSSDRAIVLDAAHLAAVAKTDKKMLAVYALPSGQKQKEIGVGWADQEVWPRISFDKSVTAMIRKNAADSAGKVLFEFLTLEADAERLGPAVTLTLDEKTEQFVDFAAASDQTIYAVGSKEKVGRIAAVDMQQGKIVWDTVFADTREFCSAVIDPDGKNLYAGNRDGILYKLDVATGEIVKKIQLLEEGETRPITNDYSVLNLAFSNDGRYFVATITPKAYLIMAQADAVFHACAPADNLVSKIAFSPDNRFFATSDIRASKPIRVWQMPEGK
ncbi:MAG: hypothetical protein L0Y36_03560 [Planctomycetales bacterium]|nr:hypothetical protein [Planctomycetales bacterium]